MTQIIIYPQIRAALIAMKKDETKTFALAHKTTINEQMADLRLFHGRAYVSKRDKTREEMYVRRVK